MYVDCLNIIKDKSSDADFTSTRRLHFNTNTDLAPHYKCGSQPVQRLNSNAELSQPRILVQMRSSAKLASQFKTWSSAKLVLQFKREAQPYSCLNFKRGAQPHPRLNSNVTLQASPFNNRVEPTRVAFLL